jgi:hypothetical protein
VHANNQADCTSRCWCAACALGCASVHEATPSQVARASCLIHLLRGAPIQYEPPSALEEHPCRDPPAACTFSQSFSNVAASSKPMLRNTMRAHVPSGLSVVTSTISSCKDKPTKCAAEDQLSNRCTAEAAASRECPLLLAMMCVYIVRVC